MHVGATFSVMEGVALFAFIGVMAAVAGRHHFRLDLWRPLPLGEMAATTHAVPVRASPLRCRDGREA